MVKFYLVILVFKVKGNELNGHILMSSYDFSFKGYRSTRWKPIFDVGVVKGESQVSL